MITPTLAIIGLYLLVLALIDYKYKEIPSIAVTGFLLVCVATHPLQLSFYFGIIGFIVTLLFYESNYIKGIADIKVMGALSFLVIDLNGFIGYVTLIVVFTMIMATFNRYYYGKNNKIEYAYLPLLFLIFCFMWAGGYYG